MQHLFTDDGLNVVCIDVACSMLVALFNDTPPTLYSLFYLGTGFNP